jgi:hypothetical protein
MEREEFLTGYCRTLDQSRMVAVLFTDEELEEVDCLYGNCPYEPSCPIAETIRELTRK